MNGESHDYRRRTASLAIHDATPPPEVRPGACLGPDRRESLRGAAMSVPLAVVSALTDTPQTISDLSRATGWSPRTIGEVLPDLCAIGVAQQDGEGYLRA